MAIFHLDVKSISRSQGRSSVSAAAYRSGEKINDERQGIEFDYSKKKGIAHSEIIAPEKSPANLCKRDTLWNYVELTEKRKDARLAQEIMVALPNELTLQENIKLAQSFCKQELSDKGLIADLNIHFDNKENPHAHILIPTREISENGLGKKHSLLRDIHFPTTIRRNWQDLANQHLFDKGLETRIDCRALKDRGIDLIPNIHLGPNIKHAIEKGYADNFDLYAAYQKNIDDNANRIIEKPEIGLKTIGDKKSYFTETDIAKLANTNSNDLAQYHAVFNAVRQSASLIEIGKDDFGKTVFTSKTNLVTELKFLENSARLELANGFKVDTKAVQDSITHQGLTQKQLDVFSYITEMGNLKTVVGYAGSGKSYLMDTCRDSWEKSGYSVKGGALSGIASESLETSSKISSRTLDSWFCSWDLGKDVLSKKDVFVLDEAGMIDTNKMTKLIEHVNQAGAKLVAIGDHEQCQPFSAGNPFKTLVNHMNKVGVLDTIYRQQDQTMSDATKLFGEGKAKQALCIYNDKNCIHTASTPEGAKQALIESWATDRGKLDNNVILAHKNKDVAELNNLARNVRIFNKEIDNGISFNVLDRKNNTNSKNFSNGDRIYFLYNDKELGVKNGSLATIDKIDGAKFSVTLDNDKKTSFDITKYKHIDHGYAATIYKSQGITVDKTYLYATKDIDRHLSYVACSRHKKDLEIFCNKVDFKDTQALYDSMSKSQQKGLAIDFAYNKNLTPNDSIISGLGNYKEAIANQLKQEGINLDTDKHNFAKAFDNIQGTIKNIATIGSSKFIEIADNIKSTLIEYTKDMRKLIGNSANVSIDHNNKISNIQVDAYAYKNLTQDINKLNIQKQPINDCSPNRGLDI